MPGAVQEKKKKDKIIASIYGTFTLCQICCKNDLIISLIITKAQKVIRPTLTNESTEA